MIARYATAEMSQLFSDEHRFSVWLKIEARVLRELARAGIVPESAAVELEGIKSVSAERVLEIEEQVKHDVIAFVSAVAEQFTSVDEQGSLGRFVHYGMTSSDLVDTGWALILVQGCELLLTELDLVIGAVLTRAREHRHTICIGRTHGQHAEPITFGLKLMSWAAELARGRTRLSCALEQIRVGKISGPVGTYSGVSPEIERAVLESLGLQPETVATQVVARDRHAELMASLALQASSIERAAVEIRHLQRTEVGEVREPFGSGQKGSSAMPHKQNPILTENLTGLTRLVRGYLTPALENVALWHERDISHSSAERIAFPDAFGVMHFVLRRFARVVQGLVVNTERMRQNLEQTGGLIYSATLLTTLVEQGLAREAAYQLVQTHAPAAVAGGATFRERVLADGRIQELLGAEGLAAVFSEERFGKHLDLIFERAEQAIRESGLSE